MRDRKRMPILHTIASSSAIRSRTALIVVRRVGVGQPGQQERVSCPCLAEKEQTRVKTHLPPFRDKEKYIFLADHSAGTTDGTMMRCNCRVDGDRSQLVVPCSMRSSYLQACKSSRASVTHAKQAEPIRISTIRPEKENSSSVPAVHTHHQHWDRS